jgi:four helix bundle protein
VRGERLEVGEKVSSYYELEVYRVGYELALKVHQMTQKFPGEEKYELGSQLRRAAVSIPANIAEGYGRKKSPAEFKHFLRNALGSSNEMCVLLNLSADLGYEVAGEILERYDILGKQLYRLIENWK